MLNYIWLLKGKILKHLALQDEMQISANVFDCSFGQVLMFLCVIPSIDFVLLP